MSAALRKQPSDEPQTTQSADGWDAFAVWRERVQSPQHAADPSPSPSSGWDPYGVWLRRVKGMTLPSKAQQG